MKIYRFDRGATKEINSDGNRNVALTPVADEVAGAFIAVLYVEPMGILGYHQALSDQLFMVLQGSGWVTGSDRKRTAIEAGQAAFWQDGEWHESGSEAGMTVVVIEAKAIEHVLMKE